MFPVPDVSVSKADCATAVAFAQQNGLFYVQVPSEHFSQRRV